MKADQVLDEVSESDKHQTLKILVFTAVANSESQQSCPSNIPSSPLLAVSFDVGTFDISMIPAMNRIESVLCLKVLLFNAFFFKNIRRHVPKVGNHPSVMEVSSFLAKIIGLYTNAMHKILNIHISFCISIRFN